MPKKVDHTERHRRIADAIWRLTADGGLDALTMRNVAAAAGMSLGRLQHYHPTKDDLLGLAFDLVRERTLAPPQPAGDDEPPGHAVHRLLAPLLPTDAGHEPVARANLGQLGLAARHPTYAAAHQKTHAERQALLVAELRAGQRRGEVAVDRDVDADARTLLALVDGLAAHVLAGTQTRDAADTALLRHLEHLFGA